MPNQNGLVDDLPDLYERKECSSEARKNSATLNEGDELCGLAAPVRLLIFTESFHPYTSGIARRFKEIIRRLSRQNFLIHVVTGCKGCETVDEEVGSKVTFGTLFALEFKDKIDCALPFLIPQPDVIHCVEHTPASTFCGAIAKTLSIPIVWSSHTNLDYYLPLYIQPIAARISVRVYQALRRTFLNIADCNLTVSGDFAQLLGKNGVNGKIHVWKTGVDSEAFNPSFRSHEMRVKMFNGNYSAEKILLVSVGRLSPEKNFEFLLKVLDRFPQAFLCIVGGGPYKEYLEPLFPAERTHFMGFLQGEELASAYASADYFIYASVSETFGQVYLEAMSSGVPIVSAEGKQMKEFFINGVHGFTWKPNELESAVRALENAIKNRTVLVQNCRSNALNHSWSAAAQQIATIYSSLAAKKYSKRKKYSALKRVRSLIVNGVYYFFVWLWLTLGVLVFMVPFMKVAKPTQENEPTIRASVKEEKGEVGRRVVCRKRYPRRRAKKTMRKRERCGYQSSSESSTSRERVLRKRLALLVYEDKIKVSPNERIESNFNELSSTSLSSSVSSASNGEKISTRSSTPLSSSHSPNSSSSTKKRAKKSKKNPPLSLTHSSNFLFKICKFFHEKTTNCFRKKDHAQQTIFKRRLKTYKKRNSHVQHASYKAIQNLSPSLILPCFVSFFIFISIYIISRIINYTNVIS